MKSVKTSELKANLAKYLRMARSGETIEVLDRGQPVATIRGIEAETSFSTVPPLGDPRELSRLKSKVQSPPKTDVVGLLMDERRRR